MTNTLREKIDNIVTPNKFRIGSLIAAVSGVFIYSGAYLYTSLYLLSQPKVMEHIETAPFFNPQL